MGVSSSKFVLLIMDDMLANDLQRTGPIVIARGTHAFKASPQKDLTLAKPSGAIKYGLSSGFALGLGIRKISLRPTQNVRLYNRMVPCKAVLQGLLEVPMLQTDYPIYNVFSDIDDMALKPEWQ
ncbi:hypothetical protein SARC_05672 [Sphaeroforma arctica JP610]|uniref:Uncharacterized protein n=1 Tax=Sphaeroforma arctica JP610 TaxID=667725 RepID=A0A0L0FYY1_9EUKA|nr:hypothetical protein SARC_05672 [Sphaeroforma arctica JP610]KNC82035.1 hypothetical protein SARC_05672 [Sphaeroforma arctica JP610]|eukprot:XP_014155937.1 hypothetical protein SARC_05672 [Sphaeroforma arctica JP610]